MARVKDDANAKDMAAKEVSAKSTAMIKAERSERERVKF